MAHSDAVKADAFAIYDAIGTKNNYAITRTTEILHIPRSTVYDWIISGVRSIQRFWKCGRSKGVIWQKGLRTQRIPS
jgi:hypothetical protein